VEFDLWVPTATPFCTGEVLRRLGRAAEDRGVRTVWVGEHVVLFEEYGSRYPYSGDGKLPAPPDAGLLEPMTALAYLAAATDRLRLGTAMCLVPQRHPVFTAKEVATVDWLSDGRLDFGVGVGWLQEEFRALGVPWPRRGARTDEYLELMKTVWSEARPSFEGEFYELPPCRLEPKPVQRPHPPLHVGGESDAALARAARVGQGWHTFNRLPPELSPAVGRLEELLARYGRRRAELRVTVCPYMHQLDVEMIERYREAGADAVAALVFVAAEGEVEPALDALEPVIDRARRC
jgi:probable F420-dependent oxidoreductase